MKKIYLLIFSILFAGNVAKSRDFDIFIAAKVDKEIITNYDIMQRLKFISYQSGIQITQQNFPQLFFQTREILIDEAIKNSAAEQFNITIADEEVDNVIADLAFKNNLSLDVFLANIEQVVDIDLFRETITHQLKWQKYLYGSLYQGLDVSEYEIDEYVQSSKNNKLYEYDLITIDFNEDQNDAGDVAQSYYQSLITNDITFKMLKKQFNGSDIKQNRSIESYANDIDSEIFSQIRLLKSGQISKPFFKDQSYVIVKLLNIKEKVVEPNEAIKQKLLMDKFERKVDTVLENLKHKAFVERYDQIQS